MKVSSPILLRYPARTRATGSGFASAAGFPGAPLGPYPAGVLLRQIGQAGILLAFGDEKLKERSR